MEYSTIGPGQEISAEGGVYGRLQSLTDQRQTV